MSPCLALRRLFCFVRRYLGAFQIRLFKILYDYFLQPVCLEIFQPDIESLFVGPYFPRLSPDLKALSPQCQYHHNLSFFHGVGDGDGDGDGVGDGDDDGDDDDE